VTSIVSSSLSGRVAYSSKPNTAVTPPQKNNPNTTAVWIPILLSCNKKSQLIRFKITKEERNYS